MLSASKSGSGLATGYNLTRSLRFRASASAYLNRTPASNGTRTTWTWSGWVKRGALGSNQCILGGGTSGTNYFTLWFTSSDTLQVNEYQGANNVDLTTTQVFRDPSSWYHIVLAYDTTQATSSNRVKLYVNGSQVTALSATTYPTQNYTSLINSTTTNYIARINSSYIIYYLDAYQTEVNFIDGQALTPSSFGSTNSLTGVWQPARYTGSYGTNGFYLPFTDNSALTTASNVGLGKDFSGNANYWVTNNISITAGATYDSMTDVPTLTSATAANFCVMNPLDSNTNVTISNGNLLLTTSANNYGARASIGINAGQWYWEATVVALGTNAFIGIADPTWTKNYVGSSLYSWSYVSGAQKYNNGAAPAYGATFTTGDIIGVAFDATAGSLTFYKNNTSQGVAFTGISSPLPLFPALSGWTSTSIAINFGQQPFTYTPPTGFVALNTYNLPTSTVVKGNTVMDATIYTGTGAIQSIVNAGGFKPDLLWIKNRARTSFHDLVDSVRGVAYGLSSNDTRAELTPSLVTSLNSNGFTLPANTTADSFFTNLSGEATVGWQWQAGQGSTSSNTNGTITSTVSVNASAGFSVVTYTGTGANATVGHGLGVAPAFIIAKSRGAATNWGVWHTSLTAYSYFLLLNTTAAQATAANSLQALPTSTLVSLGASSIFNDASTMVMYCWTPIAGFSAFGSYTGNGSTDGPFVYTGFRPKFVMIKRYDVGAPWLMLDSSRNTYNVVNNYLIANASDAEASGSSPNDIDDFLSNGFKIRCSNAGQNASGGGYIYMAFAENPTKYALAR